jgi:uncharacterized membrane protein
MMHKQNDSLWAMLAQQHLVSGEEPLSKELSSPWYIKLLLAISGWLAAAFLLGFLGAGFSQILDSIPASFMLSIILLGAAYMILNLDSNDFLEHLGLAVSLAAQVIIVITLFRYFKGDNITAWFILAMVQSVLAWLMPNYIHRLFSSYFATTALFAALWGMKPILIPLFMLAAIYLWIHEFKYPKQLQKMQSFGYGILLSLIHIESSRVFGEVLYGIKRSQYFTIDLPWMELVLTTLVMLYLMVILVKEHQADLSKQLYGALFVAIVALSASAIYIPGIMLGTLIILLGFNHSNRVLSGIGILALLFYISSYYYQLHATLLEKSMILGVLGLSLLLGRWLVLSKLLSVKEDA